MFIGAVTAVGLPPYPPEPPPDWRLLSSLDWAVDRPAADAAATGGGSYSRRGGTYSRPERASISQLKIKPGLSIGHFWVIKGQWVCRNIQYYVSENSLDILDNILGNMGDFGKNCSKICSLKILFIFACLQLSRFYAETQRRTSNFFWTFPYPSNRGGPTWFPFKKQFVGSPWSERSLNLSR